MLHSRCNWGCAKSLASVSRPRLAIWTTRNTSSGALKAMITQFQGRSDVAYSIIAEEPQGTIPVLPVHKSDSTAVVSALGGVASAWAAAHKFMAKAGEVLMLPDAEGNVSRVLLGVDSPTDLWSYSALAAKLPAGTYRVQADASVAGAAISPDAAALGWLLGQYNYERYKRKGGKDDEAPSAKPVLIWPEGADRALVTAKCASISWCRDMITTPAEEMGPQHLAAEAQALADHHSASMTLLSGQELLDHNYPAIHMVGRASHRDPVLIDLRWSPPAGTSGRDELPKLTLVGKGVCFDSGGLDIKSAEGMKLMKKDMGGAALVLALAHLVMAQRLPVRLRVLVPAVENSIAGNAFRPLDVLNTRSGLTVENGNTDAEGRLILSDALFEGASEQPDLLIDAATLTGARKVALGGAMPGVFSSDNDVWAALAAASEAEDDPMWRLPLHRPYRKALNSNVADIASTGGDGGGAIIAALFLQEFVKDVPRWLHVDTPAWNAKSSAGQPEGGEAYGLRALWRMLQQRYGGTATAATP